MTLKRLILPVLLISSLNLFGQSDYRSGYIITLKGDTLHGTIDYRGDLLMSTICKFKTSENITHDYYPNDILAFRFIDGKYFIAKEVEDKVVFLEYLIKGKVNIYYVRDENGDHYFIDKDNEKLREIPYEEGKKYVGDKQVYYQSTRHIGLLNHYMQDAPGFQSRINELKKPKHRNLIKLAEDYHNAVCEGEKCIIYGKVQPFLKVNLEAVGGVIRINSAENMSDKLSFQGGVLAHFWMPRTNEKLYLKTGFLYSQAEQKRVIKKHLMIPVHIGYMAPSAYRIRPSISIGLLSPSYSAGLAIKVTKRINIGVQSWVNFDYGEFIWIPSHLLSYSLLGNIYIQL